MGGGLALLVGLVLVVIRMLQPVPLSLRLKDLVPSPLSAQTKGDSGFFRVLLTLFIATTRYLTGNLREERFILAYNSRGHSDHGEEDMVAGVGGSWAYLSSQEGES